MAVPTEVVQGYLFGLIYNGTIYDTGDRVNGSGPEEALYSYVPLPPGPREHPNFAPEWVITPGVGELAPRRGMPVRIRTERDQRRTLSTPGARQKKKQQEKNYERMQVAKAKRSEKDKDRAARQKEKVAVRELKAAAKVQRRRERHEREVMEGVAKQARERT